MFHSHQWKTLSRTFNEPRAVRVKMAMADQEAFDRAMYGITTINQECEGCGKGRAHTVAGDAT